jgi:tetratricopeptide (TPR) repeat protein
MKILIDIELLLPMVGFSRYKISSDLLMEILISKSQIESFVLKTSVERIIPLLKNRSSLDDDSLKIALNIGLENLKIKEFEAPPSVIERIEKNSSHLDFYAAIELDYVDQFGIDAIISEDREKYINYLERDIKVWDVRELERKLSQGSNSLEWVSSKLLPSLYLRDIENLSINDKIEIDRRLHLEKCSYDKEYDLRRVNCLIKIGQIKCMSGDLEGSIESFNEARSILDEFSKTSQDINSTQKIHIFLGLGQVHEQKGNFDLASQNFQSALNSASLARNQEAEAIILDKLGDCCRLDRSLDSTKKAIAYYERAIVIARSLKNHYLETTITCNLANAYQNLEKPDLGKAEALLKEALELIVNSSPRIKAEILTSLGLCDRKKGEKKNYHTAIEYFKQALELLSTTDSYYSKSITLANLGNVYLLLGSDYLQPAKEYSQNALEISEEKGFYYSQAVAHHNLGAIFQRQSDKCNALNHFNKALTLCDKMNLFQMRGLVEYDIKRLTDWKGDPPMSAPTIG